MICGMRGCAFLPSPREAVGRVDLQGVQPCKPGWGALDCFASVCLPPPAPPHHSLALVGGGERKNR